MARPLLIAGLILGAAFCGAAFADVYRSTDGGETWEFVGLPDTRVIELHFRPDDQRVMVARADARLYESRDGGDTWTRLDDGSFSEQASMGPLFSEFSTAPLDGDSILIDHTSPSVMWALAYSADPPGESGEGIGVKRSEDGGVSWTTVESFPLPTAHILAAPVDMSRVYVAGVRTMLARPGSEAFVTTDGGRTWEQARCCGATAGGGDARVLVTDPHDPLVMYSGLRGDTAPGGDGIYFTRDGGETWDRFHGFAPDIPHSFRRPAVGTIVIDPTDTNILYATTGHGVAKNTQRGEGDWDFHPVGDNWAIPRSLALDPFDRTHLLVAKVPDRDGVMWRSTDAGETWTHVEGALDDVSVHRVVFDPRNPSVVFATTDRVAANASDDEEADDTDTGDADTGDTDTGDTDTGDTDTGDTDTGNDDAGSDDTGSDGTGNDDAGNDDTGNDDTGSDDAGNDDTGNDDTGNDDAPPASDPSDAPPPPTPPASSGGGGHLGGSILTLLAMIPAALRRRIALLAYGLRPPISH